MVRRHRRGRPLG